MKSQTLTQFSQPHAIIYLCYLFIYLFHYLLPGGPIENRLIKERWELKIDLLLLLDEWEDEGESGISFFAQESLLFFQIIRRKYLE